MNGRCARSFALAAAVLWWFRPPAGEAATLNVDCTRGTTIAATLEAVKHGDRLLVSGTCREHLVIPEHVLNVTLDGQGTATITGPDAMRHNIQVRGRGIVLKGFTITGGRNGVDVQWGGAVVIDSNTILRTGFVGIVASTGSFIGVVNNAIRDNPRGGIIVRDGSSARIGSISFFESVPRPNTIEGNGADGIFITRSASAVVGGNVIRGNGGHGVTVDRVSHAQIVNNVIESNGGSAIHVAQNSGVDIGGQGAPGWLALPNRSDGGAPNRGFGVQCSLGGYVARVLGTLAGGKGPKDFDRTCVDGLRP